MKKRGKKLVYYYQLCRDSAIGMPRNLYLGGRRGFFIVREPHLAKTDRTLFATVQKVMKKKKTFEKKWAGNLGRNESGMAQAPSGEKPF